MCHSDPIYKELWARNGFHSPTLFHYVDNVFKDPRAVRAANRVPVVGCLHNCQSITTRVIL